MSTLRLHRVTGTAFRGSVPAVLGAVGAGVLLGGLAVGYQVRHKTTTELAIGAVAIALICVIAGHPRRFLLAVVAFDLPLEWGKYLHWNPTLASVGEIPGFQVSLTTLALAGLYALWAFNRTGGAPRRPVLRPALPLFVYLAVNVASFFVASNKSLSAYQLEMLTQTLLLYIYVVSTVRTRSDVRYVVAALLAGLLLESALILIMYVTGFSPSFLGLKNHIAGSDYNGRIAGTFGTPNGAAAYLCLMVPLALGVLASSATGRLRQLALTASPLGVIALLVTQSRGGWIAFSISTAIIGAWALRRRLLAARTTAVAAIGVLALVIAFWGPISQRLTGSDGGSASSRVSLAKMAEKMIVAHPLLGVGVNNYGINIPKYAGPEFDGSWIYTVHDKYLLVWAEAGIFALLAFVWFLLATLRRGWRCNLASDRLLSPLAVGMAAGLAGQLVHMGVDIFQDRAQVEGLWLVAALLASMELILRRERRQAPRGSVAPVDDKRGPALLSQRDSRGLIRSGGPTEGAVQG